MANAPLKLRPYQNESLAAIRADWEAGVKDALLVMATGGGKTIVFLELLQQLLTSGKRALIIAHRKELIDQPIERIDQYFPKLALSAGMVMAKHNDCDRQVIVATIQTLNAKGRLEQILAYGQIDYLITDEAHHAVAAGYKNVLEALRKVNPELRHLGVTATPMRSDGDGLVSVFQKVSAKFGILELIKLGFLAPVRWLAIQTGISLKGVRSRMGDFAKGELADVYETDNCFELVVESHQQYAADRQAIAYTVSVDGAHELAAAFNAAGIPAASADGTTNKKERAQILRDFRRGKYQVLCNCALYTEGLDVPEVSCIHQVRPTKSDGLYVQIVGRALRIAPGKEDALILDYAPATDRNIAMFGDILGAPLKKKEYTKATIERGEAMGGFTFDGEFNTLDGDPMELIASELHYLELSPWHWYRSQDGSMTLGLGKASDEIERTLAITPNGDEGYALYLVAKRPQASWRAYHLQTAPLDEIQEWTENYANERGDAVLAAKKRSWRNKGPSDPQVKFGIKLKVYTVGMSRGELAARISHKLAMNAVAKVRPSNDGD